MDHASLETALATAAASLEGLKHQYERYWLGLERPEPERERTALRATFRRLLTDAEANRQTALSFRIRGAQASFRAFDELCQRRARDPATGRARNLRRTPMEAGPPPVTAATASPPTALQGTASAPPAWAPLYRQLVQSLAAHGRPAPAPQEFARQVASALLEAARAAPQAHLRPELQVTEDGRVRLLVVDIQEP